MATDHIRYDVLAQDALRSVVRRVLIDAARDGLPGEHHFFITFRTVHPHARLSQRLREKYPEEMTVVLQHQFWDLAVSDVAFEVGLSFGGIAEKLYVPFDSISAFYDPSVNFGFKVEPILDKSRPATSLDPQPPAPAPSPVRPALSEDSGRRDKPRGAATEPEMMPAAREKPGKAGARSAIGSQPPPAPRVEAHPDGKPDGKAAKAEGRAAPKVPSAGEVAPPEPPPPAPGGDPGAQVVKLDTFRKKK